MTVILALRRRSLLAAACATLLAVGVVGNQAFAQEQQGAQAPKSKAALSEIIVTTTKREETLKDVPISVGVVSSQAVQEFGLKGLEDIQAYVPNLSIQETLGSYSIRIRGIGSGASQLSFVSAVGTFVDGIYCGRPRCFQNPLFDIERIEVVRGPQGALFGKNTIAGAVSTISKGPTNDFEAEVSAGAEFAEGGYNASGIVSGPINDKLGFRLAAKFEDLDGYIHNTSTGKDENAVDSLLVRGILEWNPTDALKVRLKGETSYRDYDGYTNQLIAYGANPGTGYSNFFTTGIPFSRPESLNHETSALVIWPDGQFDDTDSSNYALQADWNFGGGYTLTSITGAVSFDFHRRTSATAYTQLFVDSDIEENYEQYSQELRLLSPTGGLFDYVVGAYYSKDNSKIQQIGVYSPIGYFTPGPVGSPTDPDSLTYNASPRSYRGEGDTISFYGSGTFHFMDDTLRAILGMRVGWDSLDGHSWLDNGTYDRVTNSFALLPYGTTRAPGGNFTVFDLYSDRDERYTLPSLTLQYDVSDDIMAYGSYAKGFKGGGFLANDTGTGSNVLAKVAETTQSGVSSWATDYAGMPTITPAQLAAGITLKENNGIYDYKPEKADSFELGAKMKFMDGALSWNIALFHTKYKNMQQSQYDGVRFITRNAAESTSKGVETDLQWLATDNLTLGINVGYVDATYDDYKNTFCKIVTVDGVLADPTCVNGQGDLSGARLERTPKYEGALHADWNSPLTAKTRLLVNGVLSYSDSYYINQNLSPLYEQDAYTKLDLRIAVADADDRWEVALIGRNLTDELTMNHAFQVGRVHVASVSTPLYVTLQGTMRFR